MRVPIPTGARLEVRDGDIVEAGQKLATLPRVSGKSRDITAGLPRVAELFEARRPKEQATISEIDGIVRLGDLTRGMRKVVVATEDESDQREYLIPHGKHLHVHDGDFVRAGDPLTDGKVNPHDILRVRGIKEVQEYLVDEIQEVYRTQGVHIDDKHIETIVRQMLQKVRIEDPGDSRFLENELVDRGMLRDEQDRVVGEGGNPARHAPLLLGITKASLTDPELRLGRLLPGDDPDPDRGLDQRVDRPAARTEGKRCHWATYPGRDGAPGAAPAAVGRPGRRAGGGGDRPAARPALDHGRRPGGRAAAQGRRSGGELGGREWSRIAKGEWRAIDRRGEAT